MSRTTRRSFAKSLAVAAAAMPVARAEDVLAQPAIAPTAPLAKALTEVVRAQYAQHLDGEELERIEKDFRP